jgi:hypothetical protein
VRQVDADVHVVGHYQGVLPQNAERALDEAVSGIESDSATRAGQTEHLIITDLTARGVLRGALGDVVFVPWGRNRVVVVAGMGAPGSFRTKELQKLMTGVALTVGRLVDRPTMATVLIGAGVGNLGVPQCVAGLVDGLRDAFESDSSLRLKRVRIAEVNLDRALDVHAALLESAPKGRASVTLNVLPLVEGTAGRIPSTFRYSMLLAAVARASGLPQGSPTRAIFDELIVDLSQRGQAEVVALQDDLQQELGKHPELRQLALRSFPIAPAAPREDNLIVSRLVFSFEGTRVRSSAITDTVTVTEREVPVSFGLLQEAMERLTRADDTSNPDPDSVQRLGRHVFTLVVHPDLEERFNAGSSARVLELDQRMAGLPWEMLVPAAEDLPVSVSAPLARQLRTPYSPRAEDARQRRIQRALVIGDPGDGEAALPKCRDEAKAVYDILTKHHIATTLRIGPTNTTDVLPVPAEPAGFFDTLVLLLHEEFDLVHYCGHAVFVPDQPDFIGWVFANLEVLAAKYVQQMRRPPLLVFANACNSAQLTGQIVQSVTRPHAPARHRASRGGGTKASSRSDPTVVAGLADEFFHRGIRDYIGTAAEVASVPAAEFATEFYTALFAERCVIGDAVQRARRKLYDARTKYGAAWGLYQHYGDPTRRVA